MDLQVFVLGLIGGWALSFGLDYLFWRPRRVCPEVEAELKESVAILKEEVSRLRNEAEGREEDDEADDEEEGDDLELIWGIGPKVEALFFCRGITTFAQLAASDAVTLESVLKSGGERYHLSRYNVLQSWQRQAALAAAGRWTELEAYQKEVARTRAGRARRQAT